MGIIIQKNMTKVISVAILALFVLSITGAAATTPKAKNDNFNFNLKNNYGNVLDNDNGKGIKVVSLSSPKLGTILMHSNGDFAYLPFCRLEAETPAITQNDGLEGTDSFTYTIKDKDGKTSSVTVTINFKCCKSIVIPDQEVID